MLPATISVIQFCQRVKNIYYEQFEEHFMEFLYAFRAGYTYRSSTTTPPTPILCCIISAEGTPLSNLYFPQIIKTTK